MFSPTLPSQGGGGGPVGAGLCKGGQHCVDRGSALGKLYFGTGTQLTVVPGEWVSFSSRETLPRRNLKGGQINFIIVKREFFFSISLRHCLPGSLA